VPGARAAGRPTRPAATPDPTVARVLERGSR
jgi:hypothetical protein